MESLLTQSGFATHSFNVRLLKTYSQGNFKMPASYNGSAPPRATLVFCPDQWLVGFQGLPIMKNVREKFCQRILPYVFKYCGVSMIITLRASNTDSRVGSKGLPRNESTTSPPATLIFSRSGDDLFRRSPYYEKRKGKFL